MITVYTLLGLTFIIFIHELGHFMVARWFGVKVYTFSIGFGPRLFTFYRDSKGTDYIFSMIPLGGYVRMKGQEDIPTSSKNPSATEPVAMEEDHFLSKKPWQRLSIILAGVKMNLISAFVFVVIAFMIGIPFSSNVIGGFLPDSPAQNSSLQIGDEIIEINGVKIETMESIITTVALGDNNSITSIKALRKGEGGDEVITADIDLRNQDLPQLGIIPKTEFAISALTEDSPLYRDGIRNGNVFEGIEIPASSGELGGRIYRGNLAVEYIKNNPGKTISLHYRDHQGERKISEVVIGERTISEKGFYFGSRIQVIKGYPAEIAGIRDGDLISSIDGHPVRFWDEILLNLQKISPGAAAKVGVMREGKELEFTVLPYYDDSRGSLILGVTAYVDPEHRGQEISMVSPAMENMVPGIRVGDALIDYQEESDLVKVEVLREGNRVSFSYPQSQLGEKTIGYLFDYALQGKTVTYSFGEAIPASFFLIKQEFTEVLGFFYLLIKGQMPLEVMGGPIAIFEVSYQVANTKGLSYFVLLLAKISISLVILNLLPIPVLDGGHACIILYEMIRRKPVPEQALKFFQVVGIAFLLFLIVYVNINDISRILSR